jgi:hypothetical protein
LNSQRGVGQQALEPVEEHIAEASPDHDTQGAIKEQIADIIVLQTYTMGTPST